MTAIAVEAVIEEARQRAKRRRLVLAGLVALLVAGGIWAGVALTGGGAAAPGPVPAGFERVGARGLVTYLALEERWYGGNGLLNTNLATWHDVSAAVTEQFWYDPAGGLTRKRLSVDGTVRGDITGQSCVGGGCWPDGYLGDFDPARAAFAAAGTGSFRGYDVRWFVRHTGEASSFEVAVDERTRKVVGERALNRGGLVFELAVLRRAHLPADNVSFLVPKSGPQRVFFSFLEPFAAEPRTPETMPLTLGHGFAAARRALGSTPLWLGPRFRGHALRAVSTGVYSFPNKEGDRLRPAPYVRFDYGSAVRVEVFGARRPWFYEHGPRPGTIVRDSFRGSAALTRDGLLIRFSSAPSLKLTPATEVALAQSLRPLPAGLETLPTLIQGS
jgi:hypothetical protein